MDDHSYAGLLTQEEKIVLAQMTKGNVYPRETLNTLKLRDGENASTIWTVYNARQK